MGRLTTHVLDVASGRPAAGMKLALLELADGARRPLAAATTDRDGRCAAPLLDGDALHSGVFEIDFHVADYFIARGVELPQPPFFDVVTIRFGIASAEQHYHVPLLVSPWSYSTYRGS